MKLSKDKKPIAIKKINILFFIVFILFAAIIFRLSYVQLVEGEKYKELADKNRTKKIPITAPRGLIKDANKEILVSNKTVWTITFQIDEDSEQDFEKIAYNLAKILAKPEDDIEQVKEDILKSMDVGPYYRASKYIPRVIKVDINEKARAYIEEHKAELPGIEIIPDQMRNYIYNDFMAQVIGYTRSIPNSELDYYQALGYKLTDRIGRYGLEKQYEYVLHGRDGENVVEVDSRYSAIKQKDLKKPIPGNNIILTVDRRFQQAVEQSMEKQINRLQSRTVKPLKDVEKATAVVLDVKTGAVLAMGNYPRFDPNWYNSPISQELYENYIMPYAANTAIRGRFPVGSTVKPLTVLMGLEEEIIEPDTVIVDKGRILYDRDPNGNPLYMKNYGSKANGPITLQQALQKSSNVFMTEIALAMREKFGIIKTLEIMRYYDRMFGLGEKTGIDLPEELPGYMSSSLNYVHHTIGQHDTFTAMQLAQYVTAIANGGYRMRPYLVQAIEDGVSGKIIYKFEPEVLNKVDISEENLKAVQEGMYEVTQPGGTAYYALRGLPIKIAAKTGTAQAAERNKDDHGIFIGYAPYESPEIAFAIIIPYGGGSSAAGPIVRDIIEAYLQIYKS
ncbi:hypothetical protein BHF71_03205 [Vulcanibacillus modesticaldus]|uniref:serine-type D-Ala-D-Ala carboxypeptidase n=1 Tax=Vulcanibacillus modesticaldus TaxID=337097 RepID=A0A1D2YSQ8_9BACI|nr:penicillin-binding transpeptidase domain-containing protein [Vulcanibacillus modesticaldus]OEF98043.1 hypothetical protein BHF71_03205 [Vulcanibacillus modesticaldus]